MTKRRELSLRRLASRSSRHWRRNLKTKSERESRQIWGFHLKSFFFCFENLLKHIFKHSATTLFHQHPFKSPIKQIILVIKPLVWKFKDKHRRFRCVKVVCDAELPIIVSDEDFCDIRGSDTLTHWLTPSFLHLSGLALNPIKHPNVFLKSNYEMSHNF